MSEPTIDCTADVRAEELASGAWVVMLRADKIPHVALLQSGTCHSLELEAYRTYPHEKLWRLIELRRTPTLLCRVDSPADAPPAAPFFERYSSLDGEDNCFLPVRDWCASWFEPAAACEYAFEVLPRMDAAGRITRSGGFHLPLRDGRVFPFPVYTQQDIRERIAHVRGLRAKKPE